MTLVPYESEIGKPIAGRLNLVEVKGVVTPRIVVDDSLLDEVAAGRRMFLKAGEKSTASSGDDLRTSLAWHHNDLFRVDPRWQSEAE